MKSQTVLIFSEKSVPVNAPEEKVITILKEMNIPQYIPTAGETVLSWTVVPGGIFIEIPMTAGQRLAMDLIATHILEAVAADCDCGGYLDRECSEEAIDRAEAFGEYGSYDYEDNEIAYDFNTFPPYLELFMAVPDYEARDIDDQFKIIDMVNALIDQRLPSGFRMDTGKVIFECNPALPIFSRSEVEKVLEACIILVLKLDQAEGYLELLNDILNED